MSLRAPFSVRGFSSDTKQTTVSKVTLEMEFLIVSTNASFFSLVLYASFSTMLARGTLKTSEINGELKN